MWKQQLLLGDVRYNYKKNIWKTASVVVQLSKAVTTKSHTPTLLCCIKYSNNKIIHTQMKASTYIQNLRKNIFQMSQLEVQRINIGIEKMDDLHFVTRNQ